MLFAAANLRHDPTQIGWPSFGQYNNIEPCYKETGAFEGDEFVCELGWDVKSRAWQ